MIENHVNNIWQLCLFHVLIWRIRVSSLHILVHFYDKMQFQLSKNKKK